MYITLTRFAVLSQCLFQGIGVPHPFVEAMWTMVAGFQNPFITERFHALSRHPNVTSLFHARIIRAIKVNVHDYMQMVTGNVADGVAGVEVPSVATMLQELCRGTFHQSTNWVDIPEAYLEPLQHTYSPPVGSVHTTGGTSTTATQATTRTGVSTLTTDT